MNHMRSVCYMHAMKMCGLHKDVMVFIIIVSCYDACPCVYK